MSKCKDFAFISEIGDFYEIYFRDREIMKFRDLPHLDGDM